MLRHFKKFVQTQKPEALHGFRVEVKKTRSFLILLEADKKNNKLSNTFKPLKKVFKQTAIIRDAYIHQQQANENHMDAPQFYKTQDAIQQKETNKLLDRQDHVKHKIETAKQQLKKRIHTVANKNIEKFLTKQIDNTIQLLMQHNFSEQLHASRKMLKHLLYNRSVISQTLAADMDINFKDIDSMQQVIGDWHDNQLTLDFFSKAMPAQDLTNMKHKQTALRKKITTKAEAFAHQNNV